MIRPGAQLVESARATRTPDLPILPPKARWGRERRPESLPPLVPRTSRLKDVSGWAVFLVLIYVVLAVKLVTVRQLSEGVLPGVYSIVVTTYILTRFLLSYLHVNPEPTPGPLPTVSFVIPCKNEGDNIQRTMLNILAVGYPHHLMDL